MSAHIDGTVVCDWCGIHLLPLTNHGRDKFYHQAFGEGDNNRPACPHTGKYYQVNWRLHMVSEVK